jgi:hypothetical protein
MGKDGMGTVYRVPIMRLKGRLPINFISSELADAGARRQVVQDGSLPGWTSPSSRATLGSFTLTVGHAAT